MTLNVEFSSGTNTVTAINQTMRRLANAYGSLWDSYDRHWVHEKHISMYIEQLVPDKPVNN